LEDISQKPSDIHRRLQMYPLVRVTDERTDEEIRCIDNRVDVLCWCWCICVGGALSVDAWMTCWCVDDCVDVLSVDALMTALMALLMCWVLMRGWLWVYWWLCSCVDVLMCWCVECWCVNGCVDALSIDAWMTVLVRWWLCWCVDDCVDVLSVGALMTVLMAVLIWCVECWCVDDCVGVLVCWCVGVDACVDVDALIAVLMAVLICWYAVLMCWCWYVDAWMTVLTCCWRVAVLVILVMLALLWWCHDALMCECVDVLDVVDLLMCWYVDQMGGFFILDWNFIPRHFQVVECASHSSWDNFAKCFEIFGGFISITKWGLQTRVDPFLAFIQASCSCYFRLILNNARVTGQPWCKLVGERNHLYDLLFSKLSKLSSKCLKFKQLDTTCDTVIIRFSDWHWLSFRKYRENHLLFWSWLNLCIFLPHNHSMFWLSFLRVLHHF
jgi:hypothetical protein